VEGLLELEEGSIRATLIRAIDTTTRKASTLARPSANGAEFDNWLKREPAGAADATDGRPV
jgi:hypothetical protein